MGSCNSNDKENNPEVIVNDTVNDTPKEIVIGDSAIAVKINPLLWYAEDSAGIKLYEPTAAGINNMSAKSLVQLINNYNNPINLEFVKTSHDTIYVRIPKSESLTENIGSTGAEMYIASTTYSLTELKGIKYVHYNFEEGDHASPGVYDRSMFKSAVK